MMLTVNDIKNALVFLNRVDLKGNESEAHAELKMKLHAMGNEMQKAAEKPQEPPPAPDQGDENPPPVPAGKPKK